MTTTLEVPPGRFGSFRQLVPREDAPPGRLLVTLGVLVVVAGVALRFWAPTPLWLDETISVNIARLPLTHIPGALAHDGAPPLYYVLLHFWMLLFGRGDVAVRALSGLISVGSIPLFWVVGRRIGGRNAAWICFFLGVSSPFAINYATATRMYSLMILWSLLGFLALARALEEPSRGRLAALGAVTAAVLYTHYWGIYLVGVTGLGLLWRIWRSGRAGAGEPAAAAAALRALRAMAIGALAWLPWAPVFVFQALHTGTPWTGSAGPTDLLGVFSDFAGAGSWAKLLTFATFALFLFGVFGRRAAPGTLTETDHGHGTSRQAVSGRAIVLELRPRPDLAPVVAVTVGTMAVAVVFGAIANAAFVARYTAVVLPLFLMVVATGVALFSDRRAMVCCVAVLCVAGLASGFEANEQQRTQAGQVAAVLNVQAQPGDLVVYCPDQLGPAVDRLLHVRGVNELTFPRAIGPQRVNWVDYKQVIDATDVGTFAQDMLSRLGAGHTLWLVWRDGYPSFGSDCGQLKRWFDLLRPGGATAVHEAGDTYYEYENLVRYPT